MKPVAKESDFQALMSMKKLPLPIVARQKSLQIKYHVWFGRIETNGVRSGQITATPKFRPVAALQDILLQCRRKVRMVSGIETNLPFALKRVESHRCEVNTLGIYACNFITFFKVSQRDSF